MGDMINASHQLFRTVSKQLRRVRAGEMQQLKASMLASKSTN